MLGCGGKRDQPEQRGRDRRNLLITRDGEVYGDSGKHGGAHAECSDAAAACQLVIAGCSAEKVRTEEGEHTVYCLRCVMVGCKGKERKSWEVRRRYREFHSLHTRMKTFGSVSLIRISHARTHTRTLARTHAHTHTHTRTHSALFSPERCAPFSRCDLEGTGI
eukprot:3254609-Rhodomonas_salina.1